MKLSFSSLPFLDRPLNELQQIFDSFHLPIELRVTNPKEQLNGNFPILLVGSSITFKSGSDKEILHAKNYLNELIEYGYQSGIVRIFLGDLSLIYPSPEPLNITGIIDALNTLTNFPFQFLIETHGQFSTSKGLLPILTKIPKGPFGVVWDVLHSIESNEDYHKTWVQLKDYIKHIHIKDAYPREGFLEDWYHTTIGEGIVPIKEIVSMVLNDGYDGYFSLEWESKWKKELQDLHIPFENILSSYISFMEGIQ